MENGKTAEDRKVDLLVALVKVGAAVISVTVVSGFLMLTWPISTPIPRHAQMWIDTANGTYLSPPCLRAGKVQGGLNRRMSDFRLVTEGDISDRHGMRPDQICRRAGGFSTKNRTPMAAILRLNDRRWTDEGEWRW